MINELSALSAQAQRLTEHLSRGGRPASRAAEEATSPGTRRQVVTTRTRSGDAKKTPDLSSTLTPRLPAGASPLNPANPLGSLEERYLGDPAASDSFRHRAATRTRQLVGGGDSSSGDNSPGLQAAGERASKDTRPSLPRSASFSFGASERAAASHHATARHNGHNIYTSLGRTTPTGIEGAAGRERVSREQPALSSLREQRSKSSNPPPVPDSKSSSSSETSPLVISPASPVGRAGGHSSGSGVCVCV